MQPNNEWQNHWQILQFKSHLKQDIACLNDGVYGIGLQTLQEMLADGSYHIEKVQRLSDMAIFFLHDDVTVFGCTFRLDEIRPSKADGKMWFLSMVHGYLVADKATNLSTSNSQPATSKSEGLAHLYTPDCIRTYSGHYLNVFQPNPDHISIQDIAHALSHQPRWAGHTDKFYSVAQHSLSACHRATPQYKLSALMHDASEAYLSDIPSPIKARMPEYKAIEDRLMHCIAQKFGFEWPMPQAVKDIDKKLLEWEWLNIKLGQNPGYAIMSMEQCKRSFLYRFEEYTAQVTA